MQGRVHIYEGYTAHDVAFYVRVFKEIGVENIILTNCSGSCNPEIVEGNIVLIKDHINMLGRNPLIGTPFKPRFISMNNCYDAKCRRILKYLFLKHNVELHEGVYLATPGPSFETRAEYKMFNLFGADCVGMSTVPESIVAT